MDPLLKAAYTNLALALKAVVDLGESASADAKAVTELLGGYDYQKESHIEFLHGLLFSLRTSR